MVTPRAVLPSGLLLLGGLLAACAYPSDRRDRHGGPYDDGLFPWRLTVPGGGPPITAEPGESWAFDFDLRVDLRQHVPEMGRFKRLLVAVYGELRHDADGAYRSSASDMVLSTRFTTAGVPIGAANMWPRLRLLHGGNGSPFEGVTAFDLPADAPARLHDLKGRLEVALPADLPRGWWHPRVTLLVEVEGVAEPVFLAMFFRERQSPPPRGFPLVEVGRPAPARLPFAILQDPRIWGRAGALPEELAGQVGVVSFSLFPTDFVLPPGRYPVGPGLPTLSPINAVPEVYNTEGVLPIDVDPELLTSLRLESCEIEGPEGRVPCLRGAEFRPEDAAENAFWAGESYGVDLTKTGTYRVHLSGFATDPHGRRFEGGGTYVVHAALPLTFSTSVKPGTSFLVGNAYPPKVNVNPPVRAEVEVTVSYWPQSDPARRHVWKTSGTCNRLGHFAPLVDRLVFDEPGEYLSEVRATYRDGLGRLWMGSQSSTGVIAPQEPTIRLRPAGGRTGPDRHGERLHSGRGLFIFNRSAVRTAELPGLPPEPSDTAFVAVQPDSLSLETRFAVDVRDPRLADALREAGATPSVVLPRPYQRPGVPWRYLEDVVLSSTYNAAGYGLVATPADRPRLTDLPIGPVARGPFDPLSFPGDERIDAWVTFGAVRPGFAGLVGVHQRAVWGSGWQLNPNAFGFQVNAGKNGDLPGDVYRVQAGVVLKDLETGVNHYDVYASSLIITAGSLPTSDVQPPGARPLLSPGGIDQHAFLATDGFAFHELGETLDFGGMVFPNVPADVTWSVVAPSGRVHVARGRADRRGIVGAPSLPADELGAWAVRAEVRHGDLVGGLPGSPDGAYWECVVPVEGAHVLRAEVAPVARIAPDGTARVPLRWPGELTDVTLHVAAITPGLVIEQARLRPEGGGWDYEFTPTEVVVRAPSFDVRMLQNGYPALADTAVLMFCLEGRDGERRVADAVNIVLRGDVLLYQRGLEALESLAAKATGRSNP